SLRPGRSETDSKPPPVLFVGTNAGRNASLGCAPRGSGPADVAGTKGRAALVASQSPGSRSRTLRSPVRTGHHTIGSLAVAGQSSRRPAPAERAALPRS